MHSKLAQQTSHRAQLQGADAWQI